MAKVFRQSALFFLVVGFLVLVKAEPLHHDDHSSKVSVKQKDHHDNEDHSSKVSIKQKDHEDDDDSYHKTKVTVKERTHVDSNTGKTVVPVREPKSGSACVCDGKLKEFAKKLSLMLRTYTSNNLGPELHKIASKFVDYVVGYLAQEKPEQMGRVNSFLQGTVKVTSGAMSKSSSN